MGVLNVTPDSFSDGGRFLDPRAAVEHGLRLVDEGASVVDVGGESTRPGALPVDEDEERRRVVQVVEALVPYVRVSIDTSKASVAHAAIDAGATLLNDVSASLHEVAAERRVGWIAMHMQGDPTSMQAAPSYGDVVREVHDFLVERAERARVAGVDEVWIDPGIGFGKTPDHNLSLLKHLDLLVATGFPVVVGTSRKRFLGRLHARTDRAASATDGPAGDDEATAPDDRLEGSIASATWAFAQGAAMVRAHDVRATVQAAQVVAA
jgi:dihydropteroate synthase